MLKDNIMKILISLIFCSVSFIGFAQNTSDENGRPIGSKPVNVVSSVENDVYLRKNKDKSSPSSLVIEYSLPAGNTSGKLVLFNPRRDEELKSITLSGNNGGVTINTKDLGYDYFNAGLYLSDGTHIQSQSID
jgi:hypothetical protein